MSEKKSLTYVEIDIPFCALRYGETTGAGTCPAVLGVDSPAKCFNTKATCPVRASFLDATVTLRYAKDGVSYLPREIDCIPSLVDASFSPGTIKPGESLGERSTLTVTFKDGPHPDTGAGYDKYRAERSYNPVEQGTYWGKFRARHPVLRGEKIRLRQGYLGQALDEMETRLFFIETCSGPTMAGTFTIEAKDVFKQLDGDRAMAPVMSRGFLSADIDDNDTAFTLSPAGIGDVDYGLSGYLAIGGKEIVAFTRSQIDPAGENDAATKILLHFDGANGSTTITDDNFGGSAHVWTATSAALSTVNKQFGTASLLTAVGYVSTPAHADFRLSNKNFCVEFFLNSNGTSGTVGLVGQLAADGSSPTSSFYILRNAENKIACNISPGAPWQAGPVSTTSVNDSVRRHIKFKRVGNILRLYVDGVQEGGDVAFTGTVPNSTAKFGIGRCGGDYAGIASSSVYIDEFRLSVETARNNTVPSAAYTAHSPLISTGDVVTITARAQKGTEAQAHKAQDRVQTVLDIFGEDVSNIIEMLMVDYAGVDPDLIPIDEWLTESEGFLGTVYTTAIAEPTPVRKLIDELIEQAALCVWWDDLAPLIRLMVLRAISTDAALFDEHNRRKDTSLSISEQPEKRVSQVWTYYAQINPLKPLDDLDNYRSAAVTVGEDEEVDEDSSAIRVVTSRWIPANARAIAQKLNNKLLRRFRTAPRTFGFSTMRYSGSDVDLGRGYNIGSHLFQDATGARVNVPVQVTRLVPAPDRFVVEAEEMRFDASDDDESHLVIIDTSGQNVDLRTVHDSQYSEAVSGDTVTCIINAGVIVSSVSTALPAFDIGSWAAGVTIVLRVLGDIRGAGGRGGNYYFPGAGAGSPGLSGGTALYTRQAINLELPSGSKLWGGGGGGGGGGANDLGKYSGGGGGGAGIIAGLGGQGAFGPGASGTDTAGGVGSSGEPATLPGGNGGGPGLAGSAGPGSTAPGGVGGAAGRAIDGVSFVTTTVSGGDLRGPTIN